VSLGCALHAQPGYPFTLSLRVDYVLDAGGLTVTLTATNEGKTACPFGMGAHPYLTSGGRLVDAMELMSPAETLLVHDHRGIPRSRRSVEGTPYDFRAGRAIGDIQLDHAFTDLARDDDGIACVTLADPDSGRIVELWMDEGYGHLMLFTGDPLPEDRRRRGLGVEPMTCPPNAFRTGEDVIRLAPGATTTASWGLREQD
jgi:aldose 1-epimerase